MAKRTTVYLQHKSYGQVKIVSARVTSVENRCFLVNADGKEKLLLADGMYWNESAATIDEVFSDFLARSEKIEAALRLKAAKAERGADTRTKVRLSEGTEQEDEAAFAHA